MVRPAKNDPVLDDGELLEVMLLSDLEQLKTLSDPLRLRVLEQFVLEPRTTKQVAVALGEKPTKLYRHVDALERVGLVRLVTTRRKRGTTERYFRAVARGVNDHRKVDHFDRRRSHHG